MRPAAAQYEEVATGSTQDVERSPGRSGSTDNDETKCDPDAADPASGPAASGDTLSEALPQSTKRRSPWAKLCGPVRASCGSAKDVSTSQ